MQRSTRGVQRRLAYHLASPSPAHLSFDRTGELSSQQCYSDRPKTRGSLLAFSFRPVPSFSLSHTRIGFACERRVQQTASHGREQRQGVVGSGSRLHWDYNNKSVQCTMSHSMHSDCTHHRAATHKSCPVPQRQLPSQPPQCRNNQQKKPGRVCQHKPFASSASVWSTERAETRNPLGGGEKDSPFPPQKKLFKASLAFCKTAASRCRRVVGDAATICGQISVFVSVNWS